MQTHPHGTHTDTQIARGYDGQAYSVSGLNKGFKETYYGSKLPHTLENILKIHRLDRRLYVCIYIAYICYCVK
jgi:hypothetical protein